MTKIIATGIYHGNRISVEAFSDAGTPKLLINGERDDVFQDEFDRLLLVAPPLGGAYHPRPDSMLAAFSVLDRSFFDQRESINVIGPLEQIPYVEGRIY